MTGLAEALEPLLQDFPGPDSDATVDERIEHARTVLGLAPGGGR